jgi:hypothetical protein
MTAGDEHEEYQRRLAARQAEQERLHALDPQHVPLYIPVDDPEFGTEALTAGWQDEGDEDEDLDVDGDDEELEEEELVEVGLAIVSWRDWQADGVLVFPSADKAREARRARSGQLASSTSTRKAPSGRRPQRIDGRSLTQGSTVRIVAPKVSC